MFPQDALQISNQIEELLGALLLGGSRREGPPISVWFFALPLRRRRYSPFAVCGQPTREASLLLSNTAHIEKCCGSLRIRQARIISARRLLPSPFSGLSDLSQSI